MICNVCENDDGFSEEEDGFVYCKLCCSQVEGIIQTAVDGEDGIYEPIHTRPRVTPPYPEPIKRDGDYYKEIRDRYTKGLVMMITYQCDALVEKFNVTPLIIGLVGPICLRFVSPSGVFDDGWADKAIHDSEIQSDEEEPEVKRRKAE